MGRIEEFARDGKNFIYFDLSRLNENDEFMTIIEALKPIIRNYEGCPLYTITNIEGVKFDTKTKKIAAEWMMHNQPYVRCGAVIGMDGIKRIMVQAIFALSGRKNMDFALTREETVEWLLKQDAASD